MAPAHGGRGRGDAGASSEAERGAETNLKPLTIAIDGPAASGKTTIGELLAKRLGYLLFDTGVMYRAVTWVALRRAVPVTDGEAVTTLAEHLCLDVLTPTVEDGRKCTVLADGEDVSWSIRARDVDAHVSIVSAYPGVRVAMVRQQRRVAAGGRVVMVGRDIGTVVLPGADLKIYLDASVEERARRRWLELEDRREETDYGTVLDSMRRRDKVDSHREVSPLRVAEGAIVVDTTGLSIEAVLHRLLNLIEGQACRHV